MRYSFILRRISLLLIFFLLFSSCDTFSDENSIVLKESVKELNGTWRIVKAIRNGTDITDQFDFSKFRIHFNNDNTYMIENRLPFLVKSDGTWSLDDPQYPFNLIFKEYNTEDKMVSGFTYPVVNGKRQIYLSFSPGCQSNIYTYVFEQTSN